MPVVTCVTWVAVLFVSSASKIALLGSTVTVLVMDADERRRHQHDRDRRGGLGGRSTPPVQVRTLVAGSTVQPAKAGAVERCSNTVITRGQRIAHDDAGRRAPIPLLPTTNV